MPKPSLFTLYECYTISTIHFRVYIIIWPLSCVGCVWWHSKLGGLTSFVRARACSVWGARLAPLEGRWTQGQGRRKSPPRYRFRHRCRPLSCQMKMKIIWRLLFQPDGLYHFKKRLTESTPARLIRQSEIDSDSVHINSFMPPKLRYVYIKLVSAIKLGYKKYKHDKNDWK
jgi:hypothetical protein